jgi:hypothetical protein
MQNSGRANEINYWVFDYDPAKELEVRERIEYMKKKNAKGTDGFELVVFDLYDMIMDYLEERDFVKSYERYETRRGFEYIIRAVSTSMKMNEDDSKDMSEAIRKWNSDLRYVEGINVYSLKRFKVDRIYRIEK